MPISFEEAVQRIAAALNPQQIILFGSRARGDNRPDSDYDLLIVVDDDAGRPMELAGRAYTAVRGKDFALDIVVCPQSEFEWSLREQFGVVSYAMDDGKVVYERSRQKVA
jgi:uncharacterized protein